MLHRFGGQNGCDCVLSRLRYAGSSCSDSGGGEDKTTRKEQRTEHRDESQQWIQICLTPTRHACMRVLEGSCSTASMYDSVRAEPRADTSRTASHDTIPPFDTFPRSTSTPTLPAYPLHTYIQPRAARQGTTMTLLYVSLPTANSTPSTAALFIHYHSTTTPLTRLLSRSNICRNSARYHQLLLPLTSTSTQHNTFSRR